MSDAEDSAQAVEDVSAELHLACFNGQTVVVQELLRDGVDVNATTQFCRSTPLFFAVQAGFSDIADLLLRHSADPNALNEEGRSPLHEAAVQGRAHIITLLLRHKADVNIATLEIGETALHLAVQWHEQRTVRALLQHGASHAAVDKEGRTPLHWAARYANTSAVRALLKAGAAANVADNHGETPLYLAGRLGHQDIVNMLTQSANRRQLPPLTASMQASVEIACHICQRQVRLTVLKDHLQHCVRWSQPASDCQQTLSSHLFAHRKVVCRPGICRIQVRRNSIWADALSFYQSCSSEAELGKEPLVHFLGEVGLDGGGPRRDFFRLLAAVAPSDGGALLEGKPPRLLFRHNVQALENGLFASLGKMTAHSILHGGPGLPCFSPAVLDYLCFGDAASRLGCELKMSVDDITDATVKNILEKLSSASCDEFRCLLQDESIALFLTVSGYCRPLAQCNAETDRQSIIHCLLYHEIILRRKAEHDQFRDGLSSLGVLSLIREHPVAMRRFLVGRLPGSAAALSVPELVAQLHPVFSTDMKSVASSNSSAEEQLFRHFVDYIHRCQNEKSSLVRVTDVLVFLTGADEIPVGGFEHPISVLFSQSSSSMPTASTCSPSISLPLIHTEETAFAAFAAMMDEAILGSKDYYGRL